MELSVLAMTTPALLAAAAGGGKRLVPRASTLPRTHLLPELAVLLAVAIWRKYLAWKLSAWFAVIWGITDGDAVCDHD